MTKAEMVDKLAEKGQMTKKLASESLDLVFSAISGCWLLATKSQC
jgi:nucleoid DNA-binding protein